MCIRRTVAQTDFFFASGSKIEMEILIVLLKMNEKSDLYFLMTCLYSYFAGRKWRVAVFKIMLSLLKLSFQPKKWFSIARRSLVKEVKKDKLYRTVLVVCRTSEKRKEDDEGNQVVKYR